jgi:ribose transport system permease protein
MNSLSSAGAGRIPLAVARPRRFLRAVLPALSLALVILGIAWLNPRAISYFGLNLMLNLGIPVALATIAQMFVLTVNDLDLSIGTFVSFVGCVAATWLRDAPLLGSAVSLSMRSLAQ